MDMDFLQVFLGEQRLIGFAFTKIKYRLIEFDSYKTIYNLFSI